MRADNEPGSVIACSRHQIYSQRVRVYAAGAGDAAFLPPFAARFLPAISESEADNRGTPAAQIPSMR